MKVKEYAEVYQISIANVYKMIKSGEIKAVKNARGHYEIETERIIFPYIKDSLKERQAIEEDIKKCNELLAQQLQLNLAFNRLVDVQDRQEGKVQVCPVNANVIFQQSTIAQYLHCKLQRFDVKMKPIKDKYDFLQMLLRDIPVEQFRPANSTISVYFEVSSNILPILLNRLMEQNCAFHFTIQDLSALSTLKVRVSDHLPSTGKSQEHLLIQFPSSFTSKGDFDSQVQGLNQFEEMQMIIGELKAMHQKKKVLWQEADRKKYFGLVLQLKTLPIDSLNAKDQSFIQHVYKDTGGYLS